MKERGNWVRIDAGFVFSVVAEMSPEAVVLWLTGLCVSKLQNSDGEIGPNKCIRLANLSSEPLASASSAASGELVSAGRWHLPGHGCERCPQPREGRVQIHDYLQWQESAAEREAQHEQHVSAGRKGGQAKALASASSDPLAPALASASSEPLAPLVARREEKRREEKRREQPSSKSATARKRAVPLPAPFEVTPDMAAWAKAKGAPTRTWLDNETEQFVNHALAHGRTLIDWTAGWRNWVAKDLDRDGLIPEPEQLATVSRFRPLTDEELAEQARVDGLERARQHEINKRGAARCRELLAETQRQAARERRASDSG